MDARRADSVDNPRVKRTLLTALVVMLVSACSAGALRTAGPTPASSLAVSPGPNVAPPTFAQAAPPPASSSPAPTPLPPGPDVQFVGLLSASEGWALTSTGLYVTADGGATWSAATVPGPRTGRGVLGVAFADPQHGWLASLDSTDYRSSVFDVWRTADGGRTWAKAVLPEGANRSDTMGTVEFSLLDPEHLFLLVEGGMADGYTGDLYASTDGGASWSPDRYTGDSGVMGGLAFADTEHGVIAGGAADDRLFVTVDAGRSWRRVAIPTPAGASSTWTSLWSAPTFWDATTGALAMNYGTEAPTGFGVLVTHDAGTTWSLAATVPLTASLGDVAVSFPSPTDWLALPDSSTLLRTGDAGRTWASSPSVGLPGVPQSLVFADAQHGWALVGMGVCLSFKRNCAYRTGLYATDDGGRSWVALWPGRPA
jgi:photosystem II stability/assembly factor-like uncharacterized protein